MAAPPALCWLWEKRVRKNARASPKSREKQHPSGPKGRSDFAPFTARLKSCPFKTRSFSAAHELHSAAKRGCSLLFPWNPECSVPTEEQTQILRLRLRMT